MLEARDELAVIRDAKDIAGLSDRLAEIGVAHVVPESLGGIEATARILRDGIVVSEGPLEGQFFVLSGLTVEDIASAAPLLEVVYEKSERSLRYRGQP